MQDKQVLVMPGIIDPPVTDEMQPERRPYLGTLHHIRKVGRPTYNCVIILGNGKKLLLKPGEYYVIKEG